MRSPGTLDADSVPSGPTHSPTLRTGTIDRDHAPEVDESAVNAMREAFISLLPRWTQQAWMEEGRCHGKTDLFFPPAAERPQARVRREAAAREVCATCPVVAECRTYARRHREHGFWGGESEEERTLAGYAPPHPIGTAKLKMVG